MGNERRICFSGLRIFAEMMKQNAPSRVALPIVVDTCHVISGPQANLRYIKNAGALTQTHRIA
jgi:hypothetical protein